MSISNDHPARWPESTASKAIPGTRVVAKVDTVQRGPGNTDVTVRCERFGRVVKLVAGAVELVTDTGEHHAVVAADVEIIGQ